MANHTCSTVEDSSQLKEDLRDKERSLVSGAGIEPGIERGTALGGEAKICS
jgi:hypothetical protein